MDETPRSDPGRTASRIFLVAILVVALVGGFVWWQSKEKSCDRWREDVRSLATDFQAALDAGSANALSFSARVTPLIEDRPSGCPRPSTILDGVFDASED